MTNDETAKALVSHRRWGWLPGMLWAMGDGPDLTFGRMGFYSEKTRGWHILKAGPLKFDPDVAVPLPDDSATVGLLWAMLVQACELADDHWEASLSSSGQVRLKHHGNHCPNWHLSVPEALLWVWAAMDGVEVEA